MRAGLDDGHASTDTPIARLLQRATPVSEISFDDTLLDYDITHRELVELFGLQPRHLRVFTQQRSLTGIFPYDDMVVFKFEHLKGLLFWDRIMVFDSHHPGVAAFIDHLRSSIRRNDLVEARKQQPFELVAVECMLDELAVYYESTFGRLHYLITAQLDKIILETGDETREDCLYKLLPLEHKINSLQVRVDRALKTLDNLLQHDEDMAACYLTYRQEAGAPAPADEHMQVELIMETYCSRFQDLLDRTAEIARQIDSSRAVFAISLDNTRNRIARMNLDISTGAFALSFSMLIAGYFGMNIRSGLEEEHPVVFLGVATAGLVGSFAIYLLCRRVLIRSANRQHRRMIDHRTFKTVLEKLDKVHDLLRANPGLSRRLVQGGKLSRSELQDMLDNSYLDGWGYEGASKHHLDHMSFYGFSSAANASAAGGSAGSASSPHTSEKELDLLFQLLNNHKEGLTNRSDLLNELVRWASVSEGDRSAVRHAGAGGGGGAGSGAGAGSGGGFTHSPTKRLHELEGALEDLVLNAASRVPAAATQAPATVKSAAAAAAQSAAAAAASLLPSHFSSLAKTLNSPPPRPPPTPTPPPPPPLTRPASNVRRSPLPPPPSPSPTNATTESRSRRDRDGVE